ncbi:MAG: phosphotransferase [Firmicutes bacterium]|nr:phosphotransferase [Bacillota bacterium]
MQDIASYSTFKTIEPINRGWSRDQKYRVETQDGRTLLLRVADISQHDRKQTEVAMMKQAAALGIPMSVPLEFGTCNDGKSVYGLLTWCEGEDAEVVLPRLPVMEQYLLGVESGEILRKLHSLPAPVDLERWGPRFNRKIDARIQMYRECGIRIDGDDQILNYIEANRHLLTGRPQCYQHGDYHVGNMVLTEDNQLSVIDFNRWDYGDPWEEFNRIVWSAAVSPHFATGQLRGYFGGDPPMEFFRLLALYIATNTISSIPWAIPFGDEEIQVMKNQAQDVLAWFDNMNNPVPTWYLEDWHVQSIDGVPYRLKAPWDLSFIGKYGKVFKVFDEQDSGNICFGVQKGEEKYFVKFAGAPTIGYSGPPEEAVKRLKESVPVYRDLAHLNLVRLLEAEEIGGGFALVFEWVDGECMGKQYPESRQRFLQLPKETRLEAFDAILSFHAHAASQGYVAIDFYDGCIMYDLTAKKTVLCDIDLYSRAPYTNNMGRMWGSTRFMSPEEFQLGAVIDEVTNVYLMGATAFALFAESDRTPEKWQLSEKLYEVAAKAVSDARSQRQQSIQQFVDEWNEAREK